LLLSVLAVLAFACSPALAHAEEATGPVYTPDVPTVPTEESSPGGHHGGGNEGGGRDAELSNTPGGSGGGTGGNGPQAGGGSHSGQSNQGSPGNGGQPEGGSKNAGGSVGNGVKLGPGTQEAGQAAAKDSSSSPLVPILIAIAVLAAISIGAFYYRQRRQDPGTPVSPKAS
jgi:hypothetical protein